MGQVKDVRIILDCGRIGGQFGQHVNHSGEKPIEEAGQKFFHDRTRDYPFLTLYSRPLE